MRNLSRENIFSFSFFLLSTLTANDNAIHGFVLPTPKIVSRPLSTTDVSLSSLDEKNYEREVQQQQQHHHQQQKPISILRHGKEISASLAASLALITALAFPLLPTHNAQAYDPSDYASETVQSAIKSLKDAKGNPDQIFKAYENIAEIVAEGKGIGGAVSFEGVQLGSGYVVDEDTSIYNPGLTLLSESEKERLVQAIIDARKSAGNQWSDNNQLAFNQLKEKLDPYHTVELGGYLKIVPVYGAILYLGVLAIQQFARSVFPAAYIVGAAAFFLPIVVLVLAGPQ